MIIQSVIGTSFQFAPPVTYDTIPGAIGGINNPSGGLILRRYDQGYHNDDSTWFDGKTPDTTTTDGSVHIETNADNYSILWTGYFIVPNNGIYSFATVSDDGSYVWMGSNAISGYNNSNAIVNNGGLHGSQWAYSNNYQMLAGQWYPIRIVFGEMGGGDVMDFYYRDNVDGNYTNVSLPFAHNVDTAATDGF